MTDVLWISDARPPRRFKPYPAYKDSGVEWLGEISLPIFQAFRVSMRWRSWSLRNLPSWTRR